MSCPNKNTDEWRALEKVHGEANAMTAYALNGNEIPSLAQAQELLKNLKIQEADEQISSSSDEFKLERAKEQRIMLERSKIGANKFQAETINKLIGMNTEYQDFLKQNIENAKNGIRPKETLSVSKFIGGTEFTGDPELYEAFKLFGTFMHDLLEKAQVEAIVENKNITAVLNDAFFDKVYAEYLAKYPFEIENMGRDEMFAHAVDMARIVGTNAFSNFKILPEVTVTGTSRTGTKVIGRLDLLVIDDQGRIQILDFKTKKVKALMDNSYGKNVPNLDYALVHLALKEFEISNRPGTGDEFKNLKKRSTYDVWKLQLDLYENMLRQNGFDVTDKRIISLIYQTDEENKKVKGSVIHVFDNQEYYIQAAGVNLDTNGYWFRDEKRVKERVAPFERAVRIEMPVAGEEIEEEKKFEKIKAEDAYEFTPQEQQMKRFAEVLKTLVTSQIEDALRKKHDAMNRPAAQKNEALIKVYVKKVQSLQNLKAVVEKLENSNPSKLLYSSNFFATVENVAEEISDYKSVMSSLYDTFKNSKSISKEMISASNAAYQKAQSAKEIITLMRELVNEAAENPENNITEQSSVRMKLSMMESELQQVVSNFREIATFTAVKMLMMPGEKVFKGVSQQLKEVYTPRIESLKAEIEKWKAGLGKLSWFQKAKNFTVSMFDEEYRQKIATELGTDGQVSLNKIMSLEKEIRKLEFLMEGYNFDEQQLEDYVTGITNPNSILYIGAQDVYNTNSLLKGWGFDKLIASASNSDLGIASITLAFKNTDAIARENIINDIKLQKFDKIRASLLEKGYNLEQVNRLVSEWRTLDVVDENGDITERKEFTMLKPYSEEYERTYRMYNMKTKSLRKEVSQAQARYYEAIGTPLEQERKDELSTKIAERDDYHTDYIDWLLKNVNTPFVEAFYSLQKAIPADIRDELQKLYLEQEAIVFQVGRGDEILLDDSDFDRLKEIDIEIKKLREKAKEQSPEYADYIDQFNDLYEYDTNENYFKVQESKALTRFSDNPEMLKRWYAENQIERPNSEWHETLSKLYEQRSEIYSQDPIIGNLLDEKRKLMRPYKVAGRFSPRYLTDEDVMQLDMLEGQIEDRIKELASDKTGADTLSKEEKARAREISEEISRLVHPELNAVYKEDFESYYTGLQSFYTLMERAQESYNEAVAEGDKQKIKDADTLLSQRIEQFFQTEQEFMVWYNKNHIGDYKIGDLASGKDVRTFKAPKSFNTEKLPPTTMRDKYMEKVPNPKYYKIKRLRIGNWTLNGEKLSNAQIEDLQADPAKLKELTDKGELDIKPGAYNPNFIKGPGNIPLPKEVQVDADGNFYIAPGTATVNTNEKYIEMMNDPDVFELYTAMSDLFFDLQERTEGKKIGYRIPGFAASAVQNIKNDGFSKAMSKQWKIYQDKNFKGIVAGSLSEQDRVESAFGELGSKLRMRFSEQLGENLQSEDAIGSIMQWATEAHYNIAMQEIAPISESMVELLKLQRSELEQKVASGQSVVVNNAGEQVNMADRLKEVTTVIDILEREQQKFLMGQFDVDNQRALKKVMNNLLTYTAFVRIGFDVANQTKNLVAGNVQAWIAAGGSDSDHYTRKNWLWAKKKVYKDFLSSYMKDWGRVSDLSIDTMIYRFFNPLQKDIMKYYSDVSGGRGRKVSEKLANVSELGFILQDKGDTEIGTTVMFAVMDKYRYPQIESTDPNTGEKIYKRDAEGNIVMIPAHEAYFVNSSGQLQIRPDVEYTKEDESLVRNIIYAEIRRAQGNYAKADQTYIERTPAGRAVLFFRKFLIPLFLNRFGYVRPNWEAAEVAAGYWRVLFMANKHFGTKAALKEFLIGSNTLEKFGSTGVRTYVQRDIEGKETGRVDVGDFYSRKIGQARRDAIVMILLTTMSMMALAYVKRKDEDEEELGVLEGNAIRVLWGVKGEALSMFPVGAGSTEYVKNFTTAVPLVREGTATIKMVNHLYSYLFVMMMNGGEEPDPEVDSQYYQEAWKDAFYARKSGRYEKGDAKIMKDLADFTGIKNFRDIFDPASRIDILKRNQ
jgi:hypothetical protein